MVKVFVLCVVMLLVTGCGTVRGLIVGFEATTAGLSQDMLGAVDGVAERDQLDIDR